MKLSRRDFLGSATTVLAAGTIMSGRVWGANDRIRVCVIGCNGRGNEHVEGFSKCEGAEVVAICDVDARVRERVAKKLERDLNRKPKVFTDLRDALQDPEIDAVSIATPHHWHTLAAVWAAQAGKHVYVEKPAAHNIYEGQQLVAASEKFNVIIMHGTQSRSSGRWLRDISLLQSGDIIGKLYMARALGYKNGNRGSIGNKPDAPAPDYLDWELWQGPAERGAYNPMYHPYNWHWFWRYGNGEIGNQGIHQMDIAVWGLNKGFPVKVNSDGGRYTYQDAGETPNTNVATFKYEDGTMLVFEVRNRWTNDEGGRMIDGKFVEGVSVGNLFYGEKGYYVEGQGFFDEKNRPIPVSDADYPVPDTRGNWQNFIDAVRAGDKKKNFADMRAAHLASGHAHLANISYRLGRSLRFDPKAEQFVDDAEANTLLTRQYAAGFEVPKLA
ncbi:MAG TPA: Gfo/Idh/MocA family oxidoreductase [Candidatus Hydrogenedentes bacterium]|nr:Gfo/Idh/MocA family oxidoreductase [Candidatus Hydrogenedentota bacterium]